MSNVRYEVFIKIKKFFGNLSRTLFLFRRLLLRLLYVFDHLYPLQMEDTSDLNRKKNKAHNDHITDLYVIPLPFMHQNTVTQLYHLFPIVTTQFQMVAEAVR